MRFEPLHSPEILLETGLQSGGEEEPGEFERGANCLGREERGSARTTRCLFANNLGWGIPNLDVEGFREVGREEEGRADFHQPVGGRWGEAVTARNKRRAKQKPGESRNVDDGQTRQKRGDERTKTDPPLLKPSRLFGLEGWWSGRGAAFLVSRWPSSVLARAVTGSGTAKPALANHSPSSVAPQIRLSLRFAGTSRSGLAR
ncbi:hypothetical protein CIHG_02896 [Coccidioides immitis H538.4]|uniref:Uncharacterized protein n=2 Tax=Coccidioides immitis TaxID=5501 RepID=A0A0J8R5Q0_COCIT|nr:hypothetical protein CISG_07345 [Coccidioides immitis RMSCC 3703]KMU85114.1 hypothetical protein CIHG_02896 [Coccidioides immitis H538.4]